MAKVTTKPDGSVKVTVEKGDNPTSIAKAIFNKTKVNVTTKQVQYAINQNTKLAPRVGKGTVLFRGTTFTVKGVLPGESLEKRVDPGDRGGSSVESYSSPVQEVAKPAPVKMPSRDVVSLVDPGIDSATIQNLLFENIGATELIKFTRHDTVDGINPYYDIISNLSDIKRRYDPASLISLQKPESSFFDIFTIKLDQKIPDQEYLDENNLSDYVYIDESGNLVVELTNLASDEIIEVEIDSNGTIYDIGEVI